MFNCSVAAFERRTAVGSDDVLGLSPAAALTLAPLISLAAVAGVLGVEVPAGQQLAVSQGILTCFTCFMQSTIVQ